MTEMTEFWNNFWFQCILDNPDKYNTPDEWTWISRNSKITWDIIEANPDYPWDWSEISRNPIITWDIIESNPDCPWDWAVASSNPNITWDIIKANPDKGWNIQCLMEEGGIGIGIE